jgi:hypothetical protein
MPNAAGGCDPYGDLPNACFNADGSAFICCGHESCPSNPGPAPRCATASTTITCDPSSSLPNQCFDAPGEVSICCPGQCGGNSPGNPTCAPSAPPQGRLNRALAHKKVLYTSACLPLSVHDNPVSIGEDTCICSLDNLITVVPINARTKETPHGGKRKAVHDCFVVHRIMHNIIH